MDSFGCLAVVVVLVVIIAWVIYWAKRHPEHPFSPFAVPHLIQSSQEAQGATSKEGTTQYPVISTAAPADRPVPVRSQPGSVADEVVKIAEPDGGALLGQWLFASARLHGDENGGHYLRVTRDSDSKGWYRIERLNSLAYLEERKSGEPLDVTVFLVTRIGHVSQATSRVVVGPIGPDLERPIPQPDDSIMPLTRYPMDGDQGRADLARLAGQLYRATAL